MRPDPLAESVDYYPPVKCVLLGIIHPEIDKKSYPPIPTFIWLSILKVLAFGFPKPKSKTQLILKSVFDTMVCPVCATKT